MVEGTPIPVNEKRVAFTERGQSVATVTRKGFKIRRALSEGPDSRGVSMLTVAYTEADNGIRVFWKL